MSSALAGIRKSPAAPLLPGHAGHGLVGFQLCGLSVVCGLCRASILAGLALMQGYASPLRSPGPSFPSAVIFRSFVRSGFAASPCNSRQPCASGCGFLAPLHPRLIARLLWRHGTARCRRTCDYGGFGNVCCCTCCIRWNWHKYNCGSIAGRWFDLTTFDDERDFFAACRALHRDEADPELMFQDYEDSGNMASECHINWAGLKASARHGMKAAKRLIVSGWRIPVRRILTPSAMPVGRG